MKKQQKQLVGMLVLVALLALGYVGVLKYNDHTAEKEAEQKESATFYVTNLEEADIIRISYEYEGETLSFVKQEEGWIYEGDTSLNIKQYRVENMAGYMAKIVAQQVIENAADKEQYGVKDTSRQITFSTADAEYVFRIGDYNSTASLYYLGAGETIYAVEGSYITCFNYTLDEMTEATAEEEQETEEAAEVEAATEEAEESEEAP